MTWFKVDDSFATHPKVMAIPRGAPRLRSVGLWTSVGTWCARHLTDGGFPRHMVAEHGGSAADARRLVEVGLWEITPEGYRFHDWADWQPSRAKVEEDREAAKERMRRNRAKPGSGHVRPNSDRTSQPVTPTPSRPVPSSAAAAADEPAAAAADEYLPTPLAILQSKLQAHTPLRGLRFDNLTADQTTRLTKLLDAHGDGPLVQVAVATCRHPAPTSAAAFLGTWEALPPAGQPLHVVRQRLCDSHGTVLSPAGTCSACVSEQIGAHQ